MYQTHSTISPWATSTQQHARHACCDHNVHVHAMLHTLQVHVLMLGGGHPCSSPGATCTQHRLLNELCTQGFAGLVLAKHQSILMLHNAHSHMHQQPCPPNTYITNHTSMCQPLPPRLLSTGARTHTHILALVSCNCWACLCWGGGGTPVAPAEPSQPQLGDSKHAAELSQMLRVCECWAAGCECKGLYNMHGIAIAG